MYDTTQTVEKNILTEDLKKSSQISFRYLKVILSAPPDIMHLLIQTGARGNRKNTLLTLKNTNYKEFAADEQEFTVNHLNMLCRSGYNSIRC